MLAAPAEERVSECIKKEDAMVQEAKEGVDQLCFVNVAGMHFASRSCERVLYSLVGRGSLLAILITHTHKHI